MHRPAKTLRSDRWAVPSLRLGIFFGLCLVAGCDHRQSIGGGFELRQAQNWNPDGHPGIRLDYRGRKVWGSVSWGEGGPQKNLHGDIFVFLTLLSPEDNSVLIDGALEEVATTNSPGAYNTQLFVVKGAGPPVLISPGILGGKGDRPSKYERYEVVHSVASDSGITVAFRYWLVEEEGRIIEHTNSIPWQDISKWLAEAEKSGKVQKSPEGVYRVRRS